jgi:hypothetical protein
MLNSTHFTATINATNHAPALTTAAANPSAGGAGSSNGSLPLHTRLVFTNPVTQQTNDYTLSAMIRRVGILGDWYFRLPPSIHHSFIPIPMNTPVSLPPISQLHPTPRGIFNALRHWDVPTDPEFFARGYAPIRNAMLAYLSTGYSTTSQYPFVPSSFHETRAALYCETTSCAEREAHRKEVVGCAFDLVCDALCLC